MKKIIGFAAVLAFAALPVTPALAGWKLIEQNQPVAVAKNPMTVTPGEDWNRSTARPIKKSEVWTRDGVSLNELYFVAALAPGETLFRDVAKKDRPLPKLGESMLLTDVPEFVESSVRISLNTAVFELTDVSPATLAGHSGVKFAFEYALEGSALRHKGLATATLIDGNLYLILFSAPATYYFDRDVAKVEAIMASAKF